MASAGPPDGSSDPSGDQRDGVTHMTPTSPSDSPGTEVGVPADCDPPGTTGESAGGGENGAKVCQFFRMKKCRFGENCRLSHSEPCPDDSGTVSSDTDDKPDEERMEKQKKKRGTRGKATKPKYSERREVNKKPRMRTADDVISRILWDSVDSSEFVVGYVDRFLGVLERPFNDFNWDTSPCDCDYSSELALPRHRIQYFTYRGHRIWDRHTRTDRVFGSTGQSLAPPFGKEEEVKETNAGNHEQRRGDLEASDGQTPAVGEPEESAHTQNSLLEEEMNTQSTDPTEVAPESEGNSCQEQRESRGPRVVEKSATRCKDATDQNSAEGQKGELSAEEKLEDQTATGQDGSWEVGEDFVTQLGSQHISEGLSPLEQREENRSGRPPKRRPTHFVAFRANTPAILSSFQQLQKEVCALLPSSAPHWQTASSLHVTMCLLVLRSPDEVAAAVDVLTQFAHLDRNPPVAVTFPVKLKHFNGRVLCLSPHPQLSLQQLNSGLQEAYRKENLLHRDSYNPRYHLTLAKVKAWDGERIFEGVGDLKVGKGLNFGRLPVNTLHLCVIDGCQVDGFYEILHTVTLR